MAVKLLAFIILVLASITVNAQSQPNNLNKFIGQAFDEIVVSSHEISVLRKAKENRQGKQLLTNVPSGTTSSPHKLTPLAPTLVSNDGTGEISDRKRKRMARGADK
ncbi:uncharacterized protein LOC106646390, partial [Copidosoma floridanum]|uniref:uncharacterized protein LOC106646390 n=1 Tax=Copidosoma floridanum TaxID=29053 RepID=UPI0006C98325